MRIPISTYRIQFNPSFAFQAAKKIIPYLAELGISDIYASPIFKARKGSLHGYDMVDPNQLNSELGGGTDFADLAEAVKRYDLGWLQDIVPNHMAFDHENLMLMDVLESGNDSEYFSFFDIEWNHPYPNLKGKLLSPFLGKFYGEALEDGEIRLRYDADGFKIYYYNLAFPLRIETYIHLLTHRLNDLKKKTGMDHPDLVKFLGLLYVLKSLPQGAGRDERYYQIRLIKTILWGLYHKNRDIKQFIDENISIFNGEKGDTETFALLNNLLSEQLFRLSFWKVATEEINYRRFFSVNELICVKVENEDVFNHNHSLVFKLIREGKITALRIDHIDGLYDPFNYLKGIREQAGNIYMVVEKILKSEEQAPSFWPIQGTTGYDFINFVNSLFCDKRGEKAFDRIYSRFTGIKTGYDNIVYEKKRLILEKHMAGDIDNLAHLLKDISGKDRHASDITFHGLKKALAEFMVHFPVYRTYLNGQLSRDKDFDYIIKAAEKAGHHNPGLFYELKFIERFLLLEFEDYVFEQEKEKWFQFIMRFQQFTGPLMAKGFEDTVLYVYNRLLSLNEVGGSPDRFGISPERFHSFNEKRGDLWPHSLNTTSTHDTKRGEDIRARINVLSEIPQEWENNLKRWSKINRKKKKKVKPINVPDKNDEYFLYQTLLGAFPFFENQYPAFTERVKAYIIKAVREAKVHTAWLKPDKEYEDAYSGFVEDILNQTKENPFLKAFLPFQKRISYYGIFNSLSQTLIKITSPGVPDFYQGTELWDLNLVDPDNRRPVDFNKRQAFLEKIIEGVRTDILRLIETLLSTKEDGGIKLLLIYKALKTRHKNCVLFRKGSYIPLETSGKFKNHIIAYARNYERNWAVTIVPRFLTGVIEEGQYPIGSEIWHDTQVCLPQDHQKHWKEAISDQVIKNKNKLMIGEVLNVFPVSLLINEEET